MVRCLVEESNAGKCGDEAAAMVLVAILQRVNTAW